MFHSYGDKFQIQKIGAHWHRIYSFSSINLDHAAQQIYKIEMLKDEIVQVIAGIRFTNFSTSDMTSKNVPDMT